MRTFAPDAPTAHFAVWNDTHQHDDTVRALDAATPEVDVLVWNGDLCNDWKEPGLVHLHDPEPGRPRCESPAGRSRS